MNIAEYTDACIKFAKDTKNWSFLPQSGRHFTTEHSADLWTETPDNAHDGIDVSWAFHMPASSIRKYAPQVFVDSLLEDIELASNDQWEHESISEHFSEKFTKHWATPEDITAAQKTIRPHATHEHAR